jgi:DeoR family transcriptional regulator of aga operon
MVEAARQTIAVCDASKFGRRSLSTIAPIKGLQAIITDRGAPADDLKVLRKAGVKVILV